MRIHWDTLLGALFVVGVLLFSVGFVFAKGIENGRDLERQEVQRQGGARYIEITIDGRSYQGWVH